jgi:hypothetical protein
MSFINKDSQVVINSKLTTVGRQLLASGRLNFSKFAIGDSEINYKFLNEKGLRPEDNMVLRPLDLQPNIKHFLAPYVGSPSVMGSVSVPLPLPTSVVNPVNNIGLFTGNNTSGYVLKTDPQYIEGSYMVDKSKITGTNTITLTTTPAIEVGEYLLIAWKGLNAASNNNGKGVFQIDQPTQYLWYKVVEVNGNVVTLDKNTPNFGGSTSVGDTHVYVFPKGESLSHFYSSPTGGFLNTNVWGFKIVYAESIEGSDVNLTVEGYPSTIYNGLKSYIGSSDVKATGIIHYTNYSKYSPYGEGFNGTSFKVELPTIMYHRNTAGRLGVTLRASGESKMVNGKLYYDLVDEGGVVVGKVFNEMKLAVIEDQEILSALSLKSNRNWTLPDMSNVYANAELTGEDFYFTYQFETSSGSAAYSSTTTLGFNTALNCQYIQKVDASKLHYVEFTLKNEHLGFARDATTMVSKKHTGYSVNRVKLLMQRVPKGVKPSPTNWLVYDYTSKMKDYSSWNGQAIPVSVLSEPIRITEGIFEQAKADDNYYSHSYINQNMPASYFQLNTTPTDNGVAYPGFTFGEESVLIGNVSVDAKAEIFKSNFVITLDAGMYNTSTNPTWVSGNTAYISEVGIYDEEENLVVIGKLSHPVEKVGNSIITITLDIDF